MNPFSAAWNWLLDGLTAALNALHTGLEPVFGEPAWGWAIIALTLIVRIILLPLAVRQTRSMKGMQAIQPKVKKIQEKYKTDRELMKKDPERYQKLKSAQNEELMALYKEEGVNPAASCLPLVLQMPIFFALFRILQPSADGQGLTELIDAPFYFITDSIGAGAEAMGLGASISAAGWPGYLLILMMAGSMFITQRQMMARNAAGGAAATQQKVMMYVFPVFLAVISFNFPLAVVLYWVTTNIWQGVQQYIMFRVTSDDADATPVTSGGSSSPSTGGGSAAASSNGSPKSKQSKSKQSKPSSGGSRSRSSGHLPSKKKS